MGSSQQLYSLTWGEFGTSLVSTVQLLRCHQDLVDVTLAAGGRSFPAHKLVLSAASPFLLSLLKSTPCKHPVLLLAGVTAPDLEALLEFVYRGEVSIDPNQLPSLLQAAHCLNIQGLAPGAISAEKPDDSSASVPTNHDTLTRDVINSFLPIRRRKRAKRRNSTGSGMSSSAKWPHLDNVSSDPENRQNSVGAPMGANHNILGLADMPRKVDDDDSSSHTTDDNSRKNNISDQPATCPLCGAILRQSRNLRRHLELLHFGVGKSTLRVRTRKTAATTVTSSEQQGSQQNMQQHPIQNSNMQQTNIHNSPSVSQPNIHAPASLLLPMTQMTPIMSHPSCQSQNMRNPQDRTGVCEPSPVLGCMIPTMPPPHDPIFRQHHVDLLRGAGLYPEPRIPPRSSTNPNLRQQVV